MCGINGIFNVKNKALSLQKLQAMNLAMKHRGPDDSGVFYNDEIALGQTRLSIIDLSSAGHQPMFSKNKNIVLVFNGEIYNFKSLKKQLGDYDFITQTDTEVIIAAYLKWGINFIDYLDGMFAIALYDIKNNVSFLIRDRLGVKPLYFYTNTINETYFASEIRSVIEGSGLTPKLNKSKISEFLTLQTVSGNETILQDIFSLEPGTYLMFKDKLQSKHTYWQPNSDINYSINKEEATNKVHDLFYESIEKRLVSDVPLGAFLSGGIDSSAVVAAMSSFGSNVNTFNINFAEGAFSEAKYAQIIAKKYKTNHTEINLKPQSFIDLLPQGIQSLDHPSIDGLNTYVVSKSTKDAGITVALSGVGGDEWFAGYPSFSHFRNKGFEKYKMIPKPVRLAISKIAQLKNSEMNRKKWEFLETNLDFYDLYLAQKSVFSQSQINKILNGNISQNISSTIETISDLSIIEWKKYLMPVLLRDTDQMGMAHSLEIREPFLDYRLVEYLLQLPDDFKFGKYPKQLLVDAMKNELPIDIIDRSKMGFVLPYELWLKKELKDYVEQGLNYIRNNDNFNENYINYLQDSYFNNKNNVRWNMIWILAVFGHWINNNNVK